MDVWAVLFWFGAVLNKQIERDSKLLQANQGVMKYTNKSRLNIILVLNDSLLQQDTGTTRLF